MGEGENARPRPSGEIEPSARAAGLSYEHGGSAPCELLRLRHPNYRALLIRVTPGARILSFGPFTWAVRLGEIAACARDDVSIWRIGGAGIHLSPIRRRYRAMFNFLEHPRVVVVGLRHPREPDEVMRAIWALTTKEGPV